MKLKGVIVAKVIFFFAGTGDDGEYYSRQKEHESKFEQDVIRVYIRGCQEERVGNGFLFPDLEIAANNVRGAFNGNQLNLDRLRENFGDGLCKIEGDAVDTNQTVDVDQIALEGFSRGAVTTYAVAKKLDDLDIPLDIIANQPVPGETTLSQPLVTKYSDLSNCRNVRSATTFLATYNLENGFIQNYFFRQMMAKFPSGTQVANFFIPHQQHLDWFSDSPIPAHINKQFSEYGYAKPRKDSARISSWYDSHPECYFTPREFTQQIYGDDNSITKDPIYLNNVMIKAEACLKTNELENKIPLTSDQAEAIISLDGQFSADERLKNDLFKLASESSNRGNQFVTIVNKVSDVCTYLLHVTTDGVSEKTDLICSHVDEYKETVFTLCQQFLMLDKPSIQDKMELASQIYQAELQFRRQALSVDRNIMRLVLKVLTNFITHITVVGLIVNSVNKALTGNWLLFQHNRSVNNVRDSRKRLLEMVDKNIAEEPPEENTDESKHNLE